MSTHRSSGGGSRAAGRRTVLGLFGLVVAVSVGSRWWGGQGQQRLGEEVASLAGPGDIRMLGSQTCAICATARLWFEQHRVPYSECVIEADAACRRTFETTRAPGTPVLLVRGRPLLGFDPQRLRDALRGAGA